MSAVEYECPASMCPLVAPNGAWNGVYAGKCTDVMCPWWSVLCDTNGLTQLVDGAEQLGGRVMKPVLGANQPRRKTIGLPREYDCPKASICRWQERAEQQGKALCPPRDALRRGIDPRVVLW